MGEQGSNVAFADRREAGRRLSQRLSHLRGDDVVVLALPRGGVPVAFEIARGLSAVLDIIVVRKLGVPSRPELAMGAIGEDGARVVNDEVVRLADIGPAELAAVERRERTELERRARCFRGDRAHVPLAGRTAIIVDDGIATGSTARAACLVARAQGAERVVLAVPVALSGSMERMTGAAEEVVLLETPLWSHAIGQSYADFSQVPDEEVVALLARASGSLPSPVLETPDGAEDEP